ncbi:serine hydrolase [Pseudoduganella chitinolytica]|uniref:Serine hydrolase n=1 Tax=Pseudoduganella chitinolytica TaxID=34070 RepID=A0ABY8BCH6_9BURK|nr:serine hydrolase [Pseudoduganella chitinolytica]WEF32452.1 serine hydrolase [Pseudoduganella chitinolytica]
MHLKKPFIAALLLAACGAAASHIPVLAADAAGAIVTNAPTAAAFDLERDVNAALKAFDVPGMAIAIVKDGQVVAARGFGMRKLGDPAPVTGKTLFEIASNSKAFTAAALAQLVDQGKLAWDDPVTKHVPEFQMYDPYVTREMTVRDLLVHRSGLGLGAGDLLWWPTTKFSTDEIIHRLRYVKPATSFRANYAYDNLLYIVAGRIVAQKTGKSWGEAVQAQILGPLGMTGTTTSVAAMWQSPDHASPHSRIGERIAVVKPMPVENAIGAVGINTNAEDFAKWMNALLASGTAGDTRLFSAAQARELWTSQTPVKIVEPKPALAATRANFNSYGLGFYVRDYRGRKLVMHGGALQGFYSRVMMLPDEKLGVAIFTNAENGASMAALGWRILDHYLGVAPTDWVGLYAAQQQQNHRDELARQAKATAARAAGSKPSLPRTAYDGEYSDPWYGSAVIRHEGRKQILSFTRTPDLTGELEHFQHDTFIVRWKERNFNADAYVTFALNPDGSIERMKMAAVSTETDFSYDFHDLSFTPVKAKAAP